MFDGDITIVGKQIDLDGTSFSIVGVTASSFMGTSLLRQDVWVPLASAKALRPSARDEVGGLELVARLRSGASRDQVRAELGAILTSSPADQRLIRLVETSFFSRPADRREGTAFFAIAFSAALLVLLVACANVGNLLLARTAARRREIAVRMSIGAGRARLIRQLLTESLVLAAIASAAGLWIARALPTFILDEGFQHADVAGRVAFAIGPDWRVVIFSAGLATVTCLAFGLAPALQASRVDVLPTLNGRAGGFGRTPIRSWLLGVQIAVSVLLLGTSSLLTRGLEHAYHLDRGFRPDGVSMLSFELPASSPISHRQAFEAAVIEAARQSIARADAAITTASPFTGWMNYTGATGGEVRSDKGVPITLTEVSPGYFTVLGIPLRAGRLLAAADTGQHRVIVNEVLARSFFRNRGPIGQTLFVFDGRSRLPIPHEIVGVVGTVDHGEGAEPAAYEALGQRSEWLWTPGHERQQPPRVLFRTERAADMTGIVDAVTRFEPRVRCIQTLLSDSVRGRLSEERLSVWLAGSVGALALLLASIGVFGAFAYAVRQQTREIGVRIALGARMREVIASVIRPGLRPLISGLVTGLLAVIVVGQLLRRSLYGLSPLDPLAHLSVAAVVTIVALAALAVPAWRATRVSAVTVLKTE
jgi:predicted permease